MTPIGPWGYYCLVHPLRMSLCGAALLIACGGSSPSPHAPAGASAGTETSASNSSDSGASDSGTSDSSTTDSDEFQLKDSATAGDAHGASESKIEATATEAAMKFFVIDKKNNEPVAGTVISLVDPRGKSYYTEETDAAGYGEVLVPVGKTYDITYLTLGQKDITAKVTVKDEPRQNIKLTLRFKKRNPPPPPVAAAPEDPPPAEVFRLDGVNFKSASAQILPDSFPRLDSVVEYMTHKKSARIQIAGHTDNVGNPKKNKALSEKRAQSCRDYLVGKGIDGSRIDAVGFGDERPIAPNDTDEGRQKNRRIEVQEL